MNEPTAAPAANEQHSKIYKLAIEVPLRLAEGESISSLVFCSSIAFWWW